ncbi:molybdopterin-dependent oxidoreductase [Pseudarthrobacter sp. J75]|uniref:molybdopterin-dependent oxidoreductase n=1 Tax=unclassified Pseudarthrobacter TaxID=2647000 RepID=UPI002E81935F|nr:MULTISPECIES: molybdopterin-dependent oxidoreductase [unclassified Pseudarthrobacter]MEE2522299.1 molybdopterin-dependent oxidoreductase [Pseudarthrobacter sp. J47]MEE2528055.1 molybdopterin-dependent oxidoreductase [Pseudarthrobacter sp. J75]MEE2568700.1 molybdopterin-dependent oxidoreductase [Pseudarthrobacter sp. J64]
MATFVPSFRQLLRRPETLASLAGVLAAAVVLSVAELLGTFFTARLTPVFALGSTFIDFTPSWLKDFAIAAFGTQDKAALLVGMAITIAALACVLGVLAYRRWWVGVAGVLLMGTIMVACVLTRSGAEASDALPTLAGTAAGVLALRLLITLVPPAAPESGRATDSPQRAEPLGPTGAAEPGPGPSRRFFLAAAGVAAVAALVGAGAQFLGAARNAAVQARSILKLPRPARPAPPVPAAVQSATPGVAPWLTPNVDFYRIDTALRVPDIDAGIWALRVHGLVEEEITLTFQDLLDSDLIEAHVTLACVSNPVGGELVGNAKWLGLPLRDVLARARPTATADMVLSTSIDGFTASTPLEVLQDSRDAILAIGMNDEPLPLEHGYPVRMVVPGLYGFVSATKWVVDLEVTRFEDKEAYWTGRGWSERGPVKTMARLEVPRESARVRAGTVAVGGTAWAQQRGIRSVEIQVDDGEWAAATLADEASVDTWRQWSFQWEATPGRHKLRVRATDGSGDVQTGEEADVVPDGATGWHTVSVTVE